MSGRLANLAAIICFAALTAAAPAWAQGGPVGYDLVSRGPGGMELRFHNMPLRGVHADDSQNALAVDFQTQVDGAPFDRLPTDFPDWISLAYANFDTGVIKATRPVTFLTRQEADGFSLRIVPRDGAPAPVVLRGPAGPPPPQFLPPAPPPPPQPTMAGRYNAYGAMRNYAALNLALRRGDDVWTKVYERSSAQGDSDFSAGSEFHAYHTGDRVIASQMHMRITLGGGLSLIGSVYDTDVHADNVRAPDGTIAANFDRNRWAGSAGFAFDSGENSVATLEGLVGNNIAGARFTGYTGDPDSYWLMSLAYHDALRDTPEELLNGGLKDQAVISTGLHLGYGLWASLGGRFTNYGVHGDASVAKTAGWDANLRWTTDIGGVLAGLTYDGHGEYFLDNVSFTGAPPTPYIPLSLRQRQTSSFTGSLSSLLWGDTLWFDLYGGYIKDRYVPADGGIYGGAFRYQPAPGVNIAFGARHSNVGLLQGELGPETSAGLTFTLGFNSPSMGDYF